MNIHQSMWVFLSLRSRIHSCIRRIRGAASVAMLQYLGRGTGFLNLYQVLYCTRGEGVGTWALQSSRDKRAGRLGMSGIGMIPGTRLLARLSRYHEVISGLGACLSGIGMIRGSTRSRLSRLLWSSGVWGEVSLFSFFFFLSIFLGPFLGLFFLIPSRERSIRSGWCRRRSGAPWHSAARSPWRKAAPAAVGALAGMSSASRTSTGISGSRSSRRCCGLRATATITAAYLTPLRWQTARPCYRCVFLRRAAPMGPVGRTASRRSSAGALS